MFVGLFCMLTLSRTKYEANHKFVVIFMLEVFHIARVASYWLSVWINLQKRVKPTIFCHVLS